LTKSENIQNNKNILLNIQEIRYSLQIWFGEISFVRRKPVCSRNEKFGMS